MASLILLVNQRHDPGKNLCGDGRAADTQEILVWAIQVARGVICVLVRFANNIEASGDKSVRPKHRDVGEISLSIGWSNSDCQDGLEYPLLYKSMVKPLGVVQSLKPPEAPTGATR